MVRFGQILLLISHDTFARSIPYQIQSIIVTETPNTVTKRPFMGVTKEG